MSNRDDEGIEEPARPRAPKPVAGDADGVRNEARRPVSSPRADDQEDQPRRRSRRGPREEDDALSGLIPYNNGMALAAYYCGVFGLIPCAGAILGPLSIIFGVMGLSKVKENPAARGTGHAITGIILGSLEALAHIIVLIVVLTGMASNRR